VTATLELDERTPSLRILLVCDLCQAFSLNAAATLDQRAHTAEQYESAHTHLRRGAENEGWFWPIDPSATIACPACQAEAYQVHAQLLEEARRYPEAVVRAIEIPLRNCILGLRAGRHVRSAPDLLHLGRGLIQQGAVDRTTRVWLALEELGPLVEDPPERFTHRPIRGFTSASIDRGLGNDVVTVQGTTGASGGEFQVAQSYPSMNKPLPPKPPRKTRWDRILDNDW